MKQYEENFLTMANATFETLIKDDSEWKQVPRIAAAVTKLGTDIEKANGVAKESIVITSGATQNKADLIDQAVSAAVRLCKPACVYALDWGDMALHDTLNVSRASLLQLRDMTLLQRLNRLVEVVDPLVDDLADYGVKPELLGLLKERIIRLSEVITQPRELTAERKSKKQLFSELISELRKTLYQLDNLMKIFDPSELYTEYRNARIVVSLGKRRKKPAAPDTPPSEPETPAE